MKNKLKAIIMLIALSMCIWTINSCKKDEATTGTDQELYEMAISSGGFTWFGNSDALLDKSSGSGHSQPFLRTRYNSIAAASLDADDRIIPGAVFAEGSFIVKELYDNPSTLARYAILYRNSGSADADAKGWVWGYINSDGSVAEPASAKGSACISCHSQADNIDYMLMNKYFP